jgi:hypothetical protein
MGLVSSNYRKPIDTGKTYELFLKYREGGTADLLVISTIPIFHKVFLSKEGQNIRRQDIEDLFQNAVPKLMLYLQYAQVQNQGGLYVGLTMLFRNAILDQVNLYRQPLMHELGSGKDEMISDYGSHRKLLAKMQLTDVLVDFVKKFEASIRFKGNEKALCMYLFDRMMKRQPLEDTVLVRSQFGRLKFLKEYTMLLMRQLIHQMGLQNQLGDFDARYS